MRYKIDKYNPEIINHNNKEYFICLVRKKLIQVKPEEFFRQQLIYFLITKLQYPIEIIDVEVPMSYFKKRAKGRADIVIFKDDISRTNETLILIECKAPEVDIRDYHFKQQIEKYNEIVNADFSILTNGNQFEIIKNKSQQLLKEIPSFKELINKNKLQYTNREEYQWTKHNYKEMFKLESRKKLIKKNIISKITPHDIIPPIIRLVDLLYDDKNIIKSTKLHSLELIKDYGLRYTNYGYAFSDGLKGYYRYFLFKQSDGNHRIISLSIYHQYDWGTYLMVAVDERQGHSMELKLDRYLSRNKIDEYLLWHNGSITVGRKGRLKNSIVIEYLNRKAPYLVENNKIKLGRFNIFKELDYNAPEVKDLLFRIAEYAILREEIRKEH